jgi:ABC-type multidrug transport system ATPase subunit
MGPALDDVTLTVDEGEWVTLFGPAACGKTTLLRVISGDLRPESGQVALWGQAPARAAERIFHVPEEPAAPGRLTVRDALMWRMGRRRIPATQRAARVAEALEVVGLADARDMPERELSRGGRVALSLAAAIASNPMLILLDNVTACLPELLTARVFAYLDGRRIADGLTVVHATCSSAEAERADAVVMLHRGKVLASEPPEQLRGRLAADRLIVEADDPLQVQRTARGIFDVEIIEDPRSIRFSARDPIEVAAQVMRHPAGGASVVHIRRGTLWEAYERLTRTQS